LSLEIREKKESTGGDDRGGRGGGGGEGGGGGGGRWGEDEENDDYEDTSASLMLWGDSRRLLNTLTQIGYLCGAQRSFVLYRLQLLNAALGTLNQFMASNGLLGVDAFNPPYFSTNTF
jgi:hypothetical protein